MKVWNVCLHSHELRITRDACMRLSYLPTFAFSGSAISYSSYPSMGEIMNVLFLLHFGPKRGGEQWMPSASAPWTAPTNCNVITAMSHMSSLVVTFFPSVTLSISPTSSTAQLLRCQTSHCLIAGRRGDRQIDRSNHRGLVRDLWRVKLFWKFELSYGWSERWLLFRWFVVFNEYNK